MPLSRTTTSPFQTRNPNQTTATIALKKEMKTRIGKKVSLQNPSVQHSQIPNSNPSHTIQLRLSKINHPHPKEKRSKSASVSPPRRERSKRGKTSHSTRERDIDISDNEVTTRTIVRNDKMPHEDKEPDLEFTGFYSKCRKGQIQRNIHPQD